MKGTFVLFSQLCFNTKKLPIRNTTTEEIHRRETMAREVAQYKVPNHSQKSTKV